MSQALDFKMAIVQMRSVPWSIYAEQNRRAYITVSEGETEFLVL